MNDVAGADWLLSQSVLQIAEGLFLSRSSDGINEVHGRDSPSAGITDVEAVILEVFSLPRTLENGVAAVHKRLAGLGPGEALAGVCALFERNLIRLVDRHTGGASPGRRVGMYGCPRLSLDEALLGDSCDVVFVGMPYDLGVTGRDGARRGPSYLRRCSRAAFDYIQDAGFPRGWWDSSRSCRVLEGVRFADVADVSCRDSARNGVAFDRLHDTVGALLAAGRLPVVIGGDHSVSYAAISAAVARHPRLGIIQFDAHPDLGRSPATSRWRRNLTHGNFMAWLEPKPEIRTVLQLGVRHLLPEPPYVSDKVVSHSGRGWLPGISEIVAALPSDLPYYVTFDVDCLDPGVISQTGTPVPGGLSYEDAREALRSLARHVEIIGVDVVELAGPRNEEDCREGATVSYLLFELLATISQRRADAALTRPGA